MICGHKPEGFSLRRVNNKRRFKQPAGYATQTVTDPRFNHALRRDAFANVEKVTFKKLFQP